jgi:hypothetical protein
MVALPTTRDMAAYDIVVTTVDGSRHANIQVKTSQKRAAFFRMPPSAKVRVGPRDYYVFVRWLPKEGRYEGFLLSGRTARVEVQRGERFQRKRIRGGTRKQINPSVYVSRKAAARANKWRKRWLEWNL